ncbi:MAG: hypothetical protein KAK00_10760 [Nanoarchaeota archaeon]|nr:hypothetical protein [Nanoarchaeota archaeon]
MNKKEMMIEVMKLINEFVNNDIDAPTFEKQYMDLWENIRDNKDIEFDSDIQRILDCIYSDCDAYCSDKSLREKYDWDEKQLLDSTKKHLKELEEKFER